MLSIRKHALNFLQICAFDNWAEMLVQRIFFRRTQVQVHRLGKIQAVVDHRGADAGSIRTCLCTPMYTQFLDNVQLPRSISVLDIGANVGGFTLLLAHRGHHMRKVVCVELNPNTYERLRFNVLTNVGLHCHIVNGALWRSEGTLSVQLGIGSTSDSIRGTGDTARYGARECTVRSCTPDSLISEFFSQEAIDICKIDIEGAEDDVLLSENDVAGSLCQCRNILIELHSQHAYNAVLQRIEGLGFRLVAKEPGKPLGVHLFQQASNASHWP